MPKEDSYNYEDDMENYATLENGWWIYTGFKVNETKDRRGRIHAHRDKSDPKICPKCDFVWAREYVQQTMNSILLSDFPRYKLKEAVCYFCVPYKKECVDDNT